MKVGFIGLGNMGAAAARNVRRAGFDLFVHDIRREAGHALEAEGATWCDSPAEMVSAVDVVMSMVFGPAQIEQVVSGPGGLLEGDCAGKVWIDLTTSTPALMRELGARFSAAGGAPVVTLGMYAGNEAAASVYRRLGFALDKAFSSGWLPGQAPPRDADPREVEPADGGGTA